MIKQKAFTFIELLVVVAILSFLLVTFYPFMVRSESVSRSVTCQKSHNGLYKACHDYASDNGHFPKSEAGDWQQQLSAYKSSEYSTVYKGFICPERESLGISKGKSDFGLNLFIGTGASQGKYNAVGIGWLPVEAYTLPDATYFISDTVTFNDPEYPYGFTGEGSLDPVRNVPDRRHLQLTRYNMTYIDGHFESLPYYSNVLRFPEWIGTMPVSASRR